jgi:hypothetical protein
MLPTIEQKYCGLLDCVRIKQDHRVHRVATAAFWRTFSDEGKISPGW